MLSTFPVSSNGPDLSSERLAESPAQDLQAPGGSLEILAAGNQVGLKPGEWEGAPHSCCAYDWGGSTSPQPE